MFCKKCGFENKDEDKFCSSCGSALKEIKKEEEVKVEGKEGSSYSAVASSPYPYRQNVPSEPRAFGITSWVFTGLLILTSFIMLVTILVALLSHDAGTPEMVFSYLLFFFTWVLISPLGYVLVGFEILFSIVFAFIQFFKKRTKFSKICLAFSIIMTVVTIVLLVVYPIVVPTLFQP